MVLECSVQGPATLLSTYTSVREADGLSISTLYTVQQGAASRTAVQLMDAGLYLVYILLSLARVLWKEGLIIYVICLKE